MLVASHEYDLRAAKKRGWQTALVLRPERKIKKLKRTAIHSFEFDYVVTDFNELADRLLTSQY